MAVPLRNDASPFAGRDGDRARRAAHGLRGRPRPLLHASDHRGRRRGPHVARARDSAQHHLRAGRPAVSQAVATRVLCGSALVQGEGGRRSAHAVRCRSAERRVPSRHELALPRADLERSLDALLARHVYGQVAVGRRVVAFATDGNEVFLGEVSQIKRVDLVRNKTTIIPERSFEWDDDTGGLGLVAGARKIIAFTNMHLEVNDLGGSGPRTHSSIEWSQVHGAKDTPRRPRASIGRAAQFSRPTAGASLPARRSPTARVTMAKKSRSTSVT